jgi:hypothetical protein
MNETVDTLVKIAEDSTSSYLTKCAGIADAYMSDAISVDEAVAIAGELGVEPSDVDSVITAAYGDALEKEAGAKVDVVKKKGREILEKIKDVSGYSKMRKAEKKFNEYAKAPGAAYTPEEVKNMGVGKEYSKAKKEFAARVGGATVATGGTAYGASKLFGKKKEDN